MSRLKVDDDDFVHVVDEVRIKSHFAYFLKEFLLDVGSENSDPFHSGNSEPSGNSRKV